MQQAAEREELIQFILRWTREQLIPKSDLELHGMVVGLGLHERFKAQQRGEKIAREGTSGSAPLELVDPPSVGSSPQLNLLDETGDPDD